MKNILTILFIVAVIGAGVVYAQVPPKYPNLVAAQSMIEKAYSKISDAQKAEDAKMGGHASKAKDLLGEAGKEIKLAIEAEADSRDKKDVDDKAPKTNPLAENINDKRHPQLAEAQQLVHDAYAKISLAQKNHEFDLGGHAGKAKKLLEEASQEIKQAAVAANK